MFLSFKINEINHIYVEIIQILIGKYFNIIFTNQINENKLKITFQTNIYISFFNLKINSL